MVISSPLSSVLQIDQSVAHDGVCLTVVHIDNDTHAVDVVAETLSKTTLGRKEIGQHINMELSVTPATLLDGHIVQGHVDTVLTCSDIADMKGSIKMRFQLPQEFAHLVIPRGSICLNGISLTVANLFKDAFEVSIIPYTLQHTNLRDVKSGDGVNVEFDVIGKYLARLAGK